MFQQELFTWPKEPFSLSCNLVDMELTHISQYKLISTAVYDSKKCHSVSNASLCEPWPQL